MAEVRTYWKDELDAIAKALVKKIRRRNKGKRVRSCGWALSIGKETVVLTVKTIVQGEGSLMFDYERGEV